MLPARCLRCGATTRSFLCPSCVDYLVAYRPLWLDPGLLPGPSLLEALGSKEVVVLSTDLSASEWRQTTSEPGPPKAIELVRILGLDAGARPSMSEGDAEVLHAFLRKSRQRVPADPSSRSALAALFRYLESCPWMPPHLATEYRLRANMLEPATGGMASAHEALARIETPEPGPTPPLPETPDEALPENLSPRAPERASEGAEQEEPTPVGPLPEPESPARAPEEPQGEPTRESETPTLPPSPIPEAEPEPGPDEDADQTERVVLQDLKERLERERADAEAWVRARSEELQVKEEALADRERSLSTKELEVEAHERAVTERLVALEKDESRRDVLRFLGTVPGMTEAEADVIATAFPDMDSLQTADVKALTQCRGVTEALARAIRFEIVPGEVEEEQRAIELREEAQAFLEEGDYEAALECYDRLLRERPEDTALWFDRAELLVLLDRPEEALQCYTRVLDVDRRNRQAWFERANLLFGLGRLADAVDALQEALRIDPAKSADLVLKAEQLRRDRHPNEAAILFQAILNVHPDEPRAVLGLGDTLLELGDIDAAEGLFARALGRDPQNPPILFRKGELLERKGRWGAAIQYYNRAIALRWDYPDPWMGKGSILLAHDRSAEALECFDKVLSFDSERVDAWAGKARAHAALAERGPAEDALAHAARVDAVHPAVKEAREAVEALGPRPSDGSEPAAPETGTPTLADAFAEIEEVLREPEPERAPPEVPADFQSFVESIEPEKEETHVLVQLAELALEAGDPQMALLRYDQAVERDSRNPDAWTGRGVALQQLERYREALVAYDRALSLKPDHELAGRWRSTCVRRIEQEDAA